MRRWFDPRAAAFAALVLAACADEVAPEEEQDPSDDDGTLNERDASAGDAGARDAGGRDAALDASGGAGDGGDRRDGGDARAPDAGDAGRADAGDGGGSDSGADCEALSYESFGEDFLSTYCARCHNATNARGEIRLDTLVEVKKYPARIRTQAVNSERMPTSGAEPSAAEREQLGDWIACGLN